ncbi:MAG: beta-ketoacyl-ACP synthase II [Parachlamydiales bacterium]|jgi:3-oxoacyl-[acyl-carrier-protein] synthase II
MSKKRIVVTGMGLVSCFGTNLQKFYQALLSGTSGVSKIASFPTDNFTTQIAAEVKDFDPTQFLDKKQARRVDKFIAYAIAAGKLALENAHLNADSLSDLNLAKCGIIIGSGMGGMNMFVENVNALNESPRHVSPFLIPYIITNMGGGLLAQEIGFMGPNYSISTACATSNHSIIAAANHIRKGDAELMICGGSEAAILPIGLAGFCNIKALSVRNDEPTRASRPFDKGRDGFVMGEGAGVLVLESLEHAQKRGAHIIAEYLGGAVSCDAYHMTNPHPEGKGVAQCIHESLLDAQISADSINYINAHATSTPAGDVAELNALKKIFANPSKVAINGTKSMIGHALGAAGGLEAIATIMAIQSGEIHGTLNLEDPEDDIGFVTSPTAMKWDVKNAISNSFGFGGHNAAIIFSKYEN